MVESVPTTHTTHNTQHRTRKVASSFLLTKSCQRRFITFDPRSSQKKPLDLKHFQFENRSRKTCHRFIIRFTWFSFSNLEGSSGGNQQPDGSINLSPLPPPPQQHTTRNTQTETETQRQWQNPSITNDFHFRHQRLHSSVLCKNKYKCIKPSTRVERPAGRLCGLCLTHTNIHAHICTFSVKKHMSIYLYTCHHESSKTQQHSKWKSVGKNRPQHMHMYSVIVCDWTLNTQKFESFKKIPAATKIEFESAS